MLALYIVVGIVLFIVLILSIPIEMAFDTRRPGAKARVGWAFGLLWKDVGGGKKKPKRPKKKKKRPGAKTFRDFLANRGSVNGLLKLARRIIGGIRVKQLDVHLRMGLDDPADTGMLYAVIWPILIPLCPCSAVHYVVNSVANFQAYDVRMERMVRSDICGRQASIPLAATSVEARQFSRAIRLGG